ncbi:MAG: hypothetical protein ACLFTT_02300 [Candidatus Hydrogenedentota bacterium]
MLLAPQEASTGAVPWRGTAHLLDGAVLLLAGACVALMGYAALTRELGFSPDSCVYVDVAQHMRDGYGLHRGVLMAFQPWHFFSGAMHVPLTLYAPLYPLLAGIAAMAGLAPPYAALAVAAVFLAVFLLGLYVLARRMYGPPVAALALALLLHFAPLLFVSGYAWSETLGLACIAWGFHFMARLDGVTREARLLAGTAGFLFGLAFATRYALLPAALLAAAWLFLSNRHRMIRINAYMAGLMPPVAVVAARNAAVLGHPFGPARGASTRPLLTNLHDLYRATVAGYLPPGYLSPENQARLLFSVAVVLIGAIILRRRWGVVHDVLRQGARALLPAWALGYLIFLLIYRTRFDIDIIGPRLVLPGLVFLIPIGTAVLVTVLSPRGMGVRGMALVLIALAFLREASEIRSTPPQRIEATIAASERLQWVCDNTTPDDLIIGDRIYDLPLFCGRRQGLCFFPDTDSKYHLRAGILQRFLRDRVGKFDQCYLVIGRVTYDEPGFEKQWRALCGGFVTDLIYGRAETWPGIREVVRLDDAYVFEVDVLEFVAPGQEPRYARLATPETMLETWPPEFQVSEKGEHGWLSVSGS